MKYQNFFLTVAFVLLFNLATACSPATVNPPTETVTVTSVSATPTKTPKPTLTPRPTRTLNVALTQSYDDLFSEVQKFNDEGIIPSTNGMYRSLDDYANTFAQIGWLQYDYFDFTVKHFVYKAHVRWSTSGDTNEISGCGIVFGVNEKKDTNDYYGVVLDKSRIFFSYSDGMYYYDLGKSRGTGKLSFGNPAEADLTLLVYDYKAYVYVDDEFIGEYTLKKDMELKGKFGYGIISGTNRGYGTRCEIENSRIWILSK